MTICMSTYHWLMQTLYQWSIPVLTKLNDENIIHYVLICFLSTGMMGDGAGSIRFFVMLQLVACKLCI